jgi:hypothetical protein
MAWAKFDGETATGSVSGITLTGTSKKFNSWVGHGISVSNGNLEWRVGTTTIDTGSNYAYRRSSNGGSDSTVTSTTFIRCGDAVTGGSDSYIVVAYACNISGEEKLIISNSVRNDEGSGAGSAPARNEIVGKWSTTSGQFDAVFFGGTSGTNWAINTSCMALGSD